MVALRVRKSDEEHVADQLIAEFGDGIDSATIRLVAEQELRLFDRAKVRTFVSVIALRLARARLQELIDKQAAAAAGTGIAVITTPRAAHVSNRRSESWS